MSTRDIVSLHRGIVRLHRGIAGLHQGIVGLHRDIAAFFSSKSVDIAAKLVSKQILRFLTERV